METKATSGIMLSLLLISTLTLAFNIQAVKAEPKTWTVDDDGGANFTRIQDAIYAASPRDAIYVYNGIYHEILYVHKDYLTIVGENKSSTIIDGGGEVVINIFSDKVVVSGFTVRNGGQSWLPQVGSAILLLESAQSCTITDNIVSNSRYGITSFSSGSNIISGNTISDTNLGIEVWGEPTMSLVATPY